MIQKVTRGKHRLADFVDRRKRMIIIFIHQLNHNIKVFYFSYFIRNSLNLSPVATCLAHPLKIYVERKISAFFSCLSNRFI